MEKGIDYKKGILRSKWKRIRLLGDLGSKDPLEEEMQPTPALLPGESPWTEEPGGLQSMESQGVRHD